MSPSELEQYLHDHIPLSRAMHVSVVAVGDDAVALDAPLGPNVNHRDTVFGGSASAVAILAALSLLHVRLDHAGVPSRVVIQRNSMRYELPIPGAFTARSSLAPAADWPRFLHTLARRGKARITVESVLEHAHRPVAHFSGEFVALGAS